MFWGELSLKEETAKILIFITQASHYSLYINGSKRENQTIQRTFKAAEPSQQGMRMSDRLGFSSKGQQCYFHRDLSCVSAASFYIIASQHYDNPNISLKIRVPDKLYHIRPEQWAPPARVTGVRALNKHATTTFPRQRGRSRGRLLRVRGSLDWV